MKTVPIPLACHLKDMLEVKFGHLKMIAGTCLAGEIVIGICNFMCQNIIPDQQEMIGDNQENHKKS